MDNPFDMLSINFYPKIVKGGPFNLPAKMNWLMFFFVMHYHLPLLFSIFMFERLN
jgi:hypothetical protein